MKSLAILFAIVLMMPFASSYAQSSQNGMAIHVQIKVENSDGALVAYLETDRVIVTDYVGLNALLDTNATNLHKTTVSLGDQKYELIKATDLRVHQSSTIVSENLISAIVGNQKPIVLAIADHDGYPVIKGDKVTTYWTILRPVS